MSTNEGKDYVEMGKICTDQGGEEEFWNGAIIKGKLIFIYETVSE